MTEYDNNGKVSLWKRDADAPEKAPALKGTVYAHRDIKAGEKLDLALWRNDSTNERAPMLTGKISDPFKPENTQAEPQNDGFRQPPAPDNDFADDDIPF